MELNSVIFPHPDFIHNIEEFSDELIFIPKIKDTSSNKNNVIGHIPCLLLQSSKKNQISKNFLIYFHGNAEDIFYAREIGDRLKQNLFINIIIVEYPGYSIYECKKSESIVLQDALYIFDYMTNKLEINSQNIFIFGRSIGSGPCCYLSSQRQFGGMILMSPFTSIKDVAKSLVGFISFVVMNRFNNIEYIKKASCPILFIHGQQDSLIPVSHTLQLKNECKCPIDVVLPEEMDHNKFDYELDLLQPMKEFLKRHTKYDCNDMYDYIIPGFLFQIPDYMKKNYVNYKQKESEYGCFGYKI